MNYTSARYDAPQVFGHSQPGAGAAHSASSSLSSNGDTSGPQHHYDSSGDYDLGKKQQQFQHGQSQQLHRQQLPRAGGARTLTGTQQVQQPYAGVHRRGQLSEELEDYGTPTANSSSSSSSLQLGGSQFTSRDRTELGRDPVDMDNSFDFLLSPPLAPVGPISTSSSFASSQNTAFSPLPPPPSHPPPPLPPNSPFAQTGNTIAVPSRPAFGRSTTAVPMSIVRDRENGRHLAQQQSQDTQFDAGLASSSSSSLNPNSIHQLPPGVVAINASALLGVVLNMRTDQPAVASASLAMARSQSAGTAPGAINRFASQQHIRNTSTGSTGSNEDSGRLGAPGLPGMMQRTASSKNVLTAGANATTGLETVDLSHQRIAILPDEVVEVLENKVERLALSYNYIANLPSAFSKLGKTLRYLNIRLNMLTVFPPVLCEMPSLEILDISRNKIRRLPPQAGTLKGLRVFSISKNRVKRLPTYFAEMLVLRVLKIDHNPLEWPPREIITQPTAAKSAAQQSSGRREDGTPAPPIGGYSKLDEAQMLQKWLTDLQYWIREHAAEAPSAVGPPPPLVASRSDDIIASEYRSRQPHQHQQQTSWPEPSLFELPPLADQPLPSMPGSATLAAPNVPLPALPSPSLSPSDDLNTPMVSSGLPGKMSPSDLPPLIVDPSRQSQHGRNASHSLTSGLAKTKSTLRAKKSLPDLRQNHAQILDERFAQGDDSAFPESLAAQRLGRKPIGHTKSSSGGSSGSPAVSRSGGLPTPPRSASGDKMDRLPFSTSQLQAALPTPVTAGPEASHPRLAQLRGLDEDAPVRSRKNGTTAANGMHMANGGGAGSGIDRNSGAYFRRLSMLPVSTISKAVPPALLQFIDSIRGILFALSQIYASLKQFVVFPASDRLPPSLSRIMASADDAMGFLIDSLDKFDSSTRRGTPEASTVKDVIETCRENVIIFGKLVGVLASQMQTLFAAKQEEQDQAADVRYMRMLVLSLYGAMGEISNAWEAMEPLRDEVVVLLQMDMQQPEGSFEANSVKLQLPTPEARRDSPSGSPVNTIASTQPLPSPALAPGQTPLNKQRAGLRRHAGSFTGYNPKF